LTIISGIRLNFKSSKVLDLFARPAYFATPETPASDQCAGAAASLAINYLNFKDEDPEYAQRCLDTAIALYEFAKKYRGLGESGGFYGSSYDHDELAWARCLAQHCNRRHAVYR